MTPSKIFLFYFIEISLTTLLLFLYGKYIYSYKFRKEIMIILLCFHILVILLFLTGLLDLFFGDGLIANLLLNVICDFLILTGFWSVYVCSKSLLTKSFIGTLTLLTIIRLLFFLMEFR